MIHQHLYRQILTEATHFCETDNLATSTITGRIGSLSRLLKGINRLTAEEIKMWVESYISHRTGHLLGPHGKNAYIISINWFLKRTALIQEPDRILAGLKRYKTEAKGQTMSPNTFESIIQFSPTIRHDLAFRLIYECGFRPHEILSIRVCDLKITQSIQKREDLKGDLEKMGHPPSVIIQLPADNPVTPSGRNKTGGRPVLVVDNAHDLLTLAQRVEVEDGAQARLFPWKHKHLSVTFSRMKRQLLNEVKGVSTPISANPEPALSIISTPILSSTGKIYNTEAIKGQSLGRLYDCRHTAITNMYLRKLPDQVIRRTVGWTPSSKMPDTYVHINEAHLITAFRTFQQLESSPTG